MVVEGYCWFVPQIIIPDDRLSEAMLPSLSFVVFDAQDSLIYWSRSLRVIQLDTDIEGI